MSSHSLLLQVAMTLSDASVLDYKDFCSFRWDAMLQQKPNFVCVRCFLRRLVLEKTRVCHGGRDGGRRGLAL